MALDYQYWQLQGSDDDQGYGEEEEIEECNCCGTNEDETVLFSIAGDSCKYCSECLMEG